ncbi:TPA: ATP-dependent RecD-like DNA helicase [Candidatus Sumerlaeota bacterium]|nr:ATP-dependent RecD-like DNA helicase [Candidatus Sumerlaeota bacterium]
MQNTGLHPFPCGVFFVFIASFRRIFYHSAVMSTQPFNRRKKPPQPLKTPPSGVLTMRGSLLRFTFHNAENGFAIARFQEDLPPGEKRAAAAPDIVVTGLLPGVQPGEALELRGQWIQNPTWGWQFAIEAHSAVPPTTALGIQAVLGSGLIAGIGPEYARRIVDVFGDRTLDILKNDPERLREVEHIGPIRMEKIREGWEEHQAVAEILSFLHSYGMSSNLALRIYKVYGNDAVHKLRDNPYRLAMDIRGMGFAGADKIARAAGIAVDAPERIQAGVVHLLEEAAGKGHSFYPFDTLSEEALELLGIDDAAMVRQAVVALCKQNAGPYGPHVVAEKLPEGDKAVYLKRLHKAETSTAEHLLGLLSTGKSLRKMDPAEEARQYELDTKFELAPKQREAVEMALRGGVTILTGGPGTGKTTTVRAIIHALRKHEVPLMLAAPTGRAAKRLSETTRLDATTIHRLLKYDPKKNTFTYNELCPLPIDYLIVDEASMLDISLMQKLLQALPSAASLLLVGDVDQLPSVGAGNVLRDLIDSGRLPVVRLDTIFRQARQSLIVMNAHRINQGEFPMLIPAEETDKGRKPDFVFVEREDPEAAVEAIEKMVSERIPKAYHLDPIQDVQIITPMHRGALGAANLNQRMQAILNKDPRTLTRNGWELRVGDKVMQTENDYDKDVFNGDIGVVHAIDPSDHIVRVRFDRRIVEYPYADLDSLTLSYAITVHKSQGSEYPAVVIPVHTQHFVMLQRNLIYTAITRGKKLVVLVGTKKAIFLALKNAKITERYSGLKQRLKNYK